MGFLNTVFIFCFFLPVPSAARLELEAMEGFWWAALPFPAPLLFFKHSFQFFLGVGTLLGCFSGVLFLFLQTYCAKKPPENVLFEPDLVRTETKKH